MGMCMIIGDSAPLTLIEHLSSLGLTTNLKLCLDAGDAASYTSGQKWLDTSGNGHDFFRGTSSSTQSSDPTFNGSAGGKSSAEYWSFDGGDKFTYDNTNETWMQNLHKDGAIFTFACWFYRNTNTPSDLWQLFGTLSDTSTDTGIHFYVDDTDYRLVVHVVNNGDEVLGVSSIAEAGVTTLNAWNFISVSINEPAGAGGIIYNLNGVGAVEAELASYVSPSASNADATATIGALGSNFPFPSGTRLAQLAMWEGTALTADNLAAIYEATRSRSGV
jgi:hypothetical protein